METLLRGHQQDISIQSVYTSEELWYSSYQIHWSQCHYQEQQMVQWWQWPPHPWSQPLQWGLWSSYPWWKMMRKVGQLAGHSHWPVLWWFCNPCQMENRDRHLSCCMSGIEPPALGTPRMGLKQVFFGTGKFWKTDKFGSQWGGSVLSVWHLELPRAGYLAACKYNSLAKISLYLFLSKCKHLSTFLTHSIHSLSVVMVERSSQMHSAWRECSKPASNWLHSIDLLRCDGVPLRTMFNAWMSCKNSQKWIFLDILIPRSVIWVVSIQSEGRNDFCSSVINSLKVRVKRCSLSVVIQSQMCMHLKALSMSLMQSSSGTVLAMKNSWKAFLRRRRVWGVVTPPVRMGQCFVTGCLTFVRVEGILV